MILKMSQYRQIAMTADPKKGELITDGLYIKHVADGQNLVCTIENMPRAVANAWIEHCIQEMQKCLAENRPALVLQDLSTSSITQTPYSKNEV